MNIYVVVDGEYATKKLYQYWVPFVNHQLTPIDYPHQFTQNNFYVFAGTRGTPGYWQMTETAVDDVNRIPGIDRLVICADTEDMTYDEKLLDLKGRVKEADCNIPIKYVIQDFCMETWLLGNNNLFDKKPRSPELELYYAKFNIREDDPQHLPPFKEKFSTRARFAYAYLLAGIKASHGNKKHYNKKSPGMAVEQTFFNRVKARCEKKQHIQSFRTFIDAFT